MQNRSHSRFLTLLLVLFAGRVMAQGWQAYHPVSWLPGFAAWHSAILPYPLLLALQLLILAAMLVAGRQLAQGQIHPQPQLGDRLQLFGTLYLGLMLLRLTLGVTVLSEQRWFGNNLSAVFHLVLAAYILVWAHFHRHKPYEAYDARR